MKLYSRIASSKGTVVNLLYCLEFQPLALLSDYVYSLQS